MATKIQNISDIKMLNDSANNFDTLSLAFDSGSFYGLEYILEDFFQNTPKMPPVSIRSSIDWFGLDS